MSVMVCCVSVAGGRRWQSLTATVIVLKVHTQHGAEIPDVCNFFTQAPLAICESVNHLCDLGYGRSAFNSRT
jgi:hypothetical protein